VATRATSVDSLSGAISKLVSKSQDAEPTVVINADKKANAENIVTVMKTAKKLNLRTVLAVDKEGK
jgi:biopolymer transport protein ExbD